MTNYSGSRISQCAAVDGDVLQGQNFAQEQPFTPIFAGRFGLTFVDCNLVNCVVPDGSIVTGCNTTQVDRCAHLYAGLSYQCEIECRHMATKQPIIVDGVEVDTLYSYADLYVGGE